MKGKLAAIHSSTAQSAAANAALLAKQVQRLYLAYAHMFSHAFGLTTLLTWVLPVRVTRSPCCHQSMLLYDVGALDKLCDCACRSRSLRH